MADPGLRLPTRPAAECVLDELTTAVVTADRDLRVSSANRKARELLGLNLPDCLGSEVRELFAGSGELERALEESVEGEEQRLSLLVHREAGVLALGMTLVRTAPEVDPQLAYVLAFRELGDGLHREMEQRRTERLTAIGRMVAGIAHEIRNPLAAMQALIEALRAELSDDDSRCEYAHRLESLLARVDRFVRVSLDFGTPQRPNLGRHDPRALAAQAIESLPASHRPRLQVIGEVPPVEVDGAQILESLLALLGNAIDAAGGAEGVDMRVAAVGGEELGGAAQAGARIDVRDEGPGLADDQLTRIFDPYFTTKPKAMGLGLAIAQTLVQSNRGRLLVRSTPGVETVFSIVLPGAEG